MNQHLSSNKCLQTINKSQLKDFSSKTESFQIKITYNLKHKFLSEVSFHGDSMLLLILFCDVGTIWKEFVLLMFHTNS